MPKLTNRTVLITGGSQGIGKAMVIRCAQEGANIVIIAKEDPQTFIHEFESFILKQIQLLGSIFVRLASISAPSALLNSLELKLLRCRLHLG